MTKRMGASGEETASSKVGYIFYWMPNLTGWVQEPRERMMVQFKKIIIGIRPAQKMFRVSSLYGSIVDEVLSSRTDKRLGADYFTGVSKLVDQPGVRLTNESLGNTLQIDSENVVFIKDYYTSEKAVDLDALLDEFVFLWEVVDKTLQVRDVRRIGIASEHQIQVADGHASAALVGNFTNIPAPVHAAKFQLQMEDRRMTTNKVGLPDFKKDDFINVIHHYYDSSLDVEHPSSGGINITLDVQRYFYPLLKSKISDEVLALFKKDFLKEKNKLDSDLKKRDLI